jgi:uncharacterized protein YjfI (DUF2170 family)
MLRITTNNDKIVIKKPDNHSLEFALSDKKLFKVIKLNINKLGGDKKECSVRLEKLSDREIYIVLNGYKLLINDLTLYEISSRMILLNNNITFPEYNYQEQENSQEE